MTGELVQDIGSRGNRVGTEEYWQPAHLRGSNETICKGNVTCDAAVAAGFELCLFDLIAGRKSFYSIAIVVTGLKGFYIGIENVLTLSELIVEERERARHVTIVEPI